MYSTTGTVEHCGCWRGVLHRCLQLQIKECSQQQSKGPTPQRLCCSHQQSKSPTTQRLCARDSIKNQDAVTSLLHAATFKRLTPQRLWLRWYQRFWFLWYWRQISFLALVRSHVVGTARDLVTHSLTADLAVRRSTPTACLGLQVANRDLTPLIHFNAYLLAVSAHVGQRTASTAQRQFDPLVYKLATPT